MTHGVTAGALGVQSVTALHDIGRSRWDSLSGAESFYLCHDWLSYVERESGVDSKYLVATGPAGLAGTLPVYASVGETYGNYETAGFFGGRLPRNPLVAGSCRAYVNDVLLAEASGQPGTQTLAVLLESAAEQAQSLGRDGTGFFYLTTPAASRMMEARGELAPVLLGLDTELELPGEDFGDYLATLGKKKAASVRKQAADFAVAGYDLSVEKLSRCWYEMGPLVAQVQRKYGNHDTADSCRTSLRMQADFLDDHTRVFTARQEDRLVSCALFYAWGDTLYGRVVGFDYEALRDAAEYFSIYFYEPARYAYRHGYRRLRLGRGSYFAKFRRGARARALWGIFTAAGERLPDWRQLNADQLSSWQADWRFSDHDVPPQWMPVP